MSTRTGNLQQAVEIKASPVQPSQFVKGFLYSLGVGQIRSQSRIQTLQIVAAIGVIGKETVQVAALDPAIGGDGPTMFSPG